MNTRKHHITTTNPPKLNGFFRDSYPFPSNNVITKEVACLEDAYSVAEAVETFSEPESLFSHSPDPDDENAICREKQCQGDSDIEFKNLTTSMSDHIVASREFGTTSKISESQISPQRQGKPDIVSQTMSNGSPAQ
ncbi:hypothetical protein SLA2020_229720 [Shorea laevis]